MLPVMNWRFVLIVTFPWVGLAPAIIIVVRGPIVLIISFVNNPMMSRCFIRMVPIPDPVWIPQHSRRVISFAIKCRAPCLETSLNRLRHRHLVFILAEYLGARERSLIAVICIVSLEVGNFSVLCVVEERKLKLDFPDCRKS